MPPSTSPLTNALVIRVDNIGGALSVRAGGARRTISFDDEACAALREFELLRDAANNLDHGDRPHLERYAAVVGDALGAALFGTTSPPTSGTLVRLSATDAELLALPWELARHDGSFVFRDGSVVLTRSAGTIASALATAEEQLRVLVAVAAPWMVDDIDYERETHNVVDSLAGVAQVSPGGTLAEIVDCLEGTTGLHLTCHGVPGGLELESDDGGSRLVSAKEFVRALHDAGRRLRLAFVAACDGTTSPEGDNGASMLHALHVAGVRDVIGYQGAMSDRSATVAARAFHSALADGESAACAVVRARAALANGHSPFAWSQLAHYQSGEDVPLELPASRAFAGRADVPFIGRRKELRDLRHLLSSKGGRFFLYGAPGVGRTRLAQALTASVPGRHAHLRVPGKGKPRSEVSDELAVWLGLPDADRDAEGASLAHILGGIRARTLSPPDGLVVLDGAGSDPDPVLLEELVVTLREAECRLLVVADYCGKHFEDGPSARLRSLTGGSAMRLVTWLPALGRLSEETRRHVVEKTGGNPGTIERVEARLASALRHVNARDTGSLDDESKVIEEALAAVNLDMREQWFVPRWAGLGAADRACLTYLAAALGPLPVPLAIELCDAALGKTGSVAEINRILRAGLISLDGSPASGFVSLDDALIRWVKEEAGPTSELHLVAASSIIARRFEAAGARERSLELLIWAGQYWFEAGDVNRAADVLGLVSERMRELGWLARAVELVDCLLETDVFGQLSRTNQRRVLATGGRAMRAYGDLGRAEELLVRGIGMATEDGDEKSISVLTGNLGNVHLDRGQLDLAEMNLRMALDSALRIGTPSHVGRAYSDLGELLKVRGRLDDAAEHYQRHLALAQKHGLRWDEGRALGRIASLQIRRGDDTAALTTLERRAALAREQTDMAGFAAARFNQGTIVLRSSNPEQARELFEEALEASRETGDTLSEARTLLLIGRTFAASGDLPRATTEFERAAALAGDLARDIRDTALRYARMARAQMRAAATTS